MVSVLWAGPFGPSGAAGLKVWPDFGRMDPSPRRPRAMSQPAQSRILSRISNLLVTINRPSQTSGHGPRVGRRCSHWCKSEFAPRCRCHHHHRPCDVL